uniref:Male reproductive organ-specific protein 4 n=1 Tax=Silene latifolia TaxID=37657 RepID=Q3C1D1_SILLA|nr:male reproductive organ-specific protein 4 [Silene latifolia]
MAPSSPLDNLKTRAFIITYIPLQVTSDNGNASTPV